MTKQTKWRFWWMFSLPKLEAWLEAMAEKGWVYDHQKLLYGFVFRKAAPVKLAYVFDLRTYLLSEYYSELTGQNWLMYTVSRHWLVWSKPYTGKRPLIASGSDETVLKTLKHNLRVLGVLLVLWIIVAFVFFGSYLGNILFRAIVIISTLAFGYNIIRVLLYRAMLETRIEMSAE